MEIRYIDQDYQQGIETFNALVDFNQKEIEEMKALLEKELNFLLLEEVESLDPDYHQKIKIGPKSIKGFTMCCDIFKNQVDRKDYSSIFLTFIQRTRKKNPEYKVINLKANSSYEVTVVIGNENLLKYKIRCSSKQAAKKVAVFKSLEELFPQGFNWILLNCLTKKEKLNGLFDDTNGKGPSFSDEIKGNDPYQELYTRFDGEILEVDINENYLEAEINMESLCFQFGNQLKDKMFSVVASKSHQKFIKISLKLDVKNEGHGVYRVSVLSKGRILFKIKIICEKKPLAKNIAGLKYLEIYCFPLFMKIYKTILDKECKISNLSQDIMDKQKTYFISQQSTTDDKDSMAGSESEEDSGEKDSFDETVEEDSNEHSVHNSDTSTLISNDSTLITNPEVQQGEQYDEDKMKFLNHDSFTTKHSMDVSRNPEQNSLIVIGKKEMFGQNEALNNSDGNILYNHQSNNFGNRGQFSVKQEATRLNSISEKTGESSSEYPTTQNSQMTTPADSIFTQDETSPQKPEVSNPFDSLRKKIVPEKEPEGNPFAQLRQKLVGANTSKKSTVSIQKRRLEEKPLKQLFRPYSKIMEVILKKMYGYVSEKITNKENLPCTQLDMRLEKIDRKWPPIGEEFVKMAKYLLNKYYNAADIKLKPTNEKYPDSEQMIRLNKCYIGFEITPQNPEIPLRKLELLISFDADYFEQNFQQIPYLILLRETLPSYFYSWIQKYILDFVEKSGVEQIHYQFETSPPLSELSQSSFGVQSEMNRIQNPNGNYMLQNNLGGIRSPTMSTAVSSAGSSLELALKNKKASEIKSEKCQKLLSFASQKYGTTIEGIIRADEIKKYKIFDFKKIKKQVEFFKKVNKFMRNSDYPSLLNLLIQKCFQLPMDIRPVEFVNIVFSLDGQDLILIKAKHANKKEGKKLGSLVLLRLLCKEIYQKIEKGIEFDETIQEFPSY